MSSRIYVATWFKALAYLIALVPGAVAFLVFVPHGSWPGGDTTALALGFAILLVSSCWLLSRVHFLSSIVLTEDGLEQSFLSVRRGFSRRVALGWDQIATVSFAQFSFHFLGKGGEKFELNTALFSNMQKTIRTVHDRLPARLQKQLDH